MRKNGFVLGNADVTVVCERPKVAAHAPAIRAILAADLACELAQISVKATTSERLGFTGRGEGIAAMAVALLVDAH
jgi:2-C-methyl-D-erythritol 2,4-cyclodiphosphate synthase